MYVQFTSCVYGVVFFLCFTFSQIEHPYSYAKLLLPLSWRLTTFPPFELKREILNNIVVGCRFVHTCCYSEAVVQVFLSMTKKTSMNFAKFLRAPFFMEHFWWLLLTISDFGVSTAILNPADIFGKLNLGPMWGQVNSHHFSERIGARRQYFHFLY